MHKDKIKKYSFSIGDEDKDIKELLELYKLQIYPYPLLKIKKSQSTYKFLIVIISAH